MAASVTHERIERDAPRFEPAHFAPERCPCCGEALTPGVLKGANGRWPNAQCKCDSPMHRVCYR